MSAPKIEDPRIVRQFLESSSSRCHSVGVHNPFDQLAKKVGKEALTPCGATLVQHEISRDAQHADLRHDPDPTRHAERAQLGLLGRLASVLCLLNIYAHSPSSEELRASLSLHFAHWQELLAKARARNKRRKDKDLAPEPIVEPFLWIVAATFSAPMLAKIGARSANDWPAGVYFHGEDVYRVGIVVADELPRERATILVRIMAAGPVLADAMADLAALPPDAHERIVAEQILIHLQNALAKKPSRSPEEEEFIATMQSTWEKARKMGRDEGRDEGRAEEAVRAVLTALRVRGLAVSEAERQRILAEKDPARLERWLEKAIVAKSVAEVFDKPSVPA